MGPAHAGAVAFPVVFAARELAMRTVRRIVLVLLGLIAVPVFAAEVPLADFAKHAQFRQVRLSPNGDYLAASAVVDDQPVLSLLRLADMSGKNIGMPANTDVADFRWVGPEKLLYAIGER